MNWDRFQGIWKQLKGGVRVGWGKLTNDHLAVIAGRREIRAGRLQEAYGIGKKGAGRLDGDWHKPMREAATLRTAATEVDDTGLHRIDAPR
jgi:uncharacterized protein YjbJ (UPF0337 family)